MSGRPVESFGRNYLLGASGPLWCPNRVGAIGRTTGARGLPAAGAARRGCYVGTAGLCSICRITNIKMYGAAARQVAFKASWRCGVPRRQSQLVKPRTTTSLHCAEADGVHW